MTEPIVQRKNYFQGPTRDTRIYWLNRGFYYLGCLLGIKQSSMARSNKIQRGQVAYFLLFLFILLAIAGKLSAHGSSSDPDVELHVFENGETWTSCSFQIHESLTQQQFNQFAREAGSITYFHGLSGASQLEKGKFEVTLGNTYTPIDQTSGAWNNTFAHPAAEEGGAPHWLGDQVMIPHLRARMGIGRKWELGGYITRDFNANYGFYGWELKRSKEIREDAGAYSALRLSHSELFRPEDIKLKTFALDWTFSKKWDYLEVYGGLSGARTVARERSDKVDLKREKVWSPTVLAGAQFQYKWAVLGVQGEYGVVNTAAMKVGVSF